MMTKLVPVKSILLAMMPDEEAHVVCLTDNEHVVVDEFVLWDFQVQWSWALANTSGAVVMRSVARAKVAVEVTGVGDGHAAKMRADAEQDEPLGLLGAHVVRLRVAQAGHVDAALSLDLSLGAVAHEERLVSPLERHVLSFRYVAQLDFDLGQSEDISGWRHVRYDVIDDGLGAVGGRQANAECRQIRVGLAVIGVIFGALDWILRVLVSVVRKVGYLDVGVSESDRKALRESVGHFQTTSKTNIVH